MSLPAIRRRDLIVVAGAAAAAIGLRRALPAAARGPWSERLDFATLGAGDGWPGWTCANAANLRRDGQRGLLEAGTDVFPCDPRPVAFAVDRRFRDGEVAATVTAIGAGAGVVLRRVGPQAYYAAVLDAERSVLIVVRRLPGEVAELGRAAFPVAAVPVRLSLAATGNRLVATAQDATGRRVAVSADDRAPELRGPGDPGVLATARTLLPSEDPALVPGLGNTRLLPYGVQEGQAFLQTPVGQAFVDAIWERSTAVFEAIEIRATQAPRPTTASVVAATAGPPATRGAALRVASDVPARVEIEVATNRRFRRSRRVRAGLTDEFDAAIATVRRLPAGRRVYWRAHLRRRGITAVGPTRSFRVVPPRGRPDAVTVAIGSCAAQFGPIFDRLADVRPDVFVWQGDLNYPDTMGPLAQTVPAFAGIWREFLANPRMAPILERSMFAAQRDDHDYGIQDANSTNLVAWGLTPWESLVEPRRFYRFAAGLAEFWVLDQRRHKTDPAAPDGPAKTLLGAAQREWLLRTLAGSAAPFKVVCSPCTLAPLSANARDGSWAAGYTAERDLLLAHVRDHVRGRVLFVTGDTHWTMVYDGEGLFEARPCPLGIPAPNDITLAQPLVAAGARRTPGVLYADDERGHFGLIEVRGDGATARLDLTLVRDDGERPFHRTFEEPLARR